jgi:hypothetical protein
MARHFLLEGLHHGREAQDLKNKAQSRKWEMGKKSIARIDFSIGQCG